MEEDGDCLGRALALPASATEKGEHMDKNREKPSHPKSSIERVQTGARLNKPLVKVLKAVAEFYDISLGALIEFIVLENLAGRAPFDGPTLARIEPFLEIYDLKLSDKPDQPTAPLPSDRALDEP